MNASGLVREAVFVDTPRGIFTASGVWFRTRVEDVEAYAGDVLTHEPLARLLAQAEHWLRLPQVLALWLLPALLVLLDPLQAAAATLVIFAAAMLLTPLAASRVLVWPAAVLGLVPLQLFYYLGVLSLLSFANRIDAVVVGLVGFVLLRWGLVEAALRPAARRLWPTLFALPVADQVLRGFIVRAALRYRVALPHVAQLEEQVIKTYARFRKLS